MPKCKKIDSNCIWIVPPERQGFYLHSALLTKLYWNNATDIVRVCVTAVSSRTLKRDVNRKYYIQNRFGSKAMDSLYELLCHYSLSSPDPLLVEHLSYLLTSFSPHNFDNFVHEHSDDDPYYSDYNISAFYSDDSTNFS